MARAGAIIVLLVLLVGCATGPARKPADPDAAWERRQTVLTQLQTWTLDGKLAVVANQEGWYAGLRWHQDGNNFQIDLLDSFGRIVVRIEGDDKGVTLIQHDGQTTTAANAESLMRELYGWSLPVSGLRYWVLGLPGPGSGSREHGDHRRIDDYGRLTELKQAGWTVDYNGYHNSEPFDLPDKIAVSGHRLRVKLIVDEWDFTGA